MDTEKKASLLAALAEEYEPSEADADRVFAKIQASLLAAGAPAPTTPAALPVGAAGLRVGRHALGLGLACATVALLGGAAVTMRSGGSPAPATLSAPCPPTPPPAAAEVIAIGPAQLSPSVSVNSLPLPAPAPDVAANVAANVTRGRAMAAAPAPVAAAQDPETLENEARLLAEARRAVQRGESEGALALLDEHVQTYPHGFLSGDRAAERIMVLCSLGRREQAVREAKEFLAGRPAGPLTRRVTMSCARNNTDRSEVSR